MSKINVNTVDTQCGSTLTLGSSGKTVTLASGASQSGFGRTGTVDWCTTAKTSPFTATSGDGFFINTTSGSVTVTLPASPSAGDIVSIADYTNTFCTHNVIVGRNGSKIGGICEDATLSTQGQSVTLIYVDGTEGWKNVQDSTSNVTGNPGFITATGGTITTSGDYKIHTFNSSSDFQVTNTFGSGVGAKVSYVVVAGGGGGGGGGGGAGGFREGKCSSDPYTDSPLDSGTALTISTQTYPITVGAGGTAGNGFGSCRGTNGNNSVFSTITSTGGGGGGISSPCASKKVGNPGGSGGGSGNCGSGTATAGSGNTPPVSPPQGSNGGTSSPGPGANVGFGGGGGATAVGTNGSQGSPPSPGNGGTGGAGVTTSITASPVAYAGGGGGGVQAPQNPTSSATSGGAGGGGSGHGNVPAPTSPSANGTANTGGGGGGNTSVTAGTGGSGIVVIRYKFQ